MDGGYEEESLDPSEPDRNSNELNGRLSRPVGPLLGWLTLPPRLCQGQERRKCFIRALFSA